MLVTKEQREIILKNYSSLLDRLEREAQQGKTEEAEETKKDIMFRLSVLFETL